MTTTIAQISDKQYEQAKACALFGKVMSRGKDNKPTHFVVPGKDAKQYEVFFRRDEIGQITAKCYASTMNGLGPTCKGSINICYHILGALIISAEEAGYELIRNNGNINNILQEKILYIRHNNNTGKYKSFIFRKKKGMGAEKALKDLGY